MRLFDIEEVAATVDGCASFDHVPHADEQRGNAARRSASWRRFERRRA
jgi:hypothetical protein